MATTEREILEKIAKRLEVLIGLLVETAPALGSRGRTAEEQTIRLARAGLRPVEIADILSRQASNVTRDITKARAEGKLSKAQSSKTIPTKQKANEKA